MSVIHAVDYTMKMHLQKEDEHERRVEEVAGKERKGRSVQGHMPVGRAHF